MNPTEYEQHVARVLRTEGWAAAVTPPSADGGVDVVANRPGRRLGIQAKMYGAAGRVVNQQVIHELFGAATAQGCTEFLLATDGRVSAGAQASADKLGVQIRQIAVVEDATGPLERDTTPGVELDFGHIWEQVARLAGETLSRGAGTSNQILSVDGGGVLRITSGGRKQRLEIEIFRWTVERLLAGETVTRAEINQRYVKRGSSGVVLILSSLPVFETTTVGGKLALRVARGQR